MPFCWFCHKTAQIVMVIHCDSNQSVLFLYPRLCVHNVTGLSPGKEYQFRILAENFYGRSDPCEPTAPIKTEMAPEGKLRKEGGLIISGCWHVKGKHNYLWIIIFLFIKHWLESTPITYLSEPQDKWQLYIRKCTLVVMGYYGRWLDIQLPRWTSWRSKSWSAARTGYI